MIWDRFTFDSIYLYKQPVDMRKSIDGLSSLVSGLSFEPTAPNLFIFTNRSRDKIKMLLWERNGFWLFYKRLSRQKFHWPDWFETDTLSLDEEKTDLLLQGFNLNGMRPHKVESLAHYY